MNSEENLYPQIEEWLNQYLKEKYKGYSIETTHKTSKQYLDIVLRSMGIRCDLAIGLQIKIDIIGVLKRGNDVKFVFVEVKDASLTLKDLGQLWGYTQLIDPKESFLISSKGFGKLSHLFNILKREDLLRYGKDENKLMKIAMWDEDRKSIDWGSVIPKV